MKIKAQIAMVMNLDKCIGCHTCSITCKNTWTNRRGAEYMYFNNVETKPGIGYPKKWEDQEHYKGGWELKDGKLSLKSGSKASRMLKLFYHPQQPTMQDYFEPWTYDYETLIHSGRKNHQPIARPRSVLTNEKMEIEWGPNWEDDLAGGNEHAVRDVNLANMQEKIKFDYERVFMKYLPRLCNHCLNPACVAACPSGAVYKREEDGVVLVSQDACRGWRHCIPACPYKKIYFNWETNKAEKCVLCYPRLENGQPTICSETCVGRMRYLGVLLYDADAVEAAAATADASKIYQKQQDLILDPNDAQVQRLAREAGISENWLEAARLSPVYKMIKQWQIALPLHMEYRTLPMVWYIPPMSPILNHVAAEVFLPQADQMRIPIEYLAQLFAAGDQAVIRRTLQRLSAVRVYMNAKSCGEAAEPSPDSDLTAEEIEAMFHLLAVAKLRDRFVVPAGCEREQAELCQARGTCGFPGEKE